MGRNFNIASIIVTASTPSALISSFAEEAAGKFP